MYPPVLLLLLLLLNVDAKILMVQTLTRHGTRAPDKIVGQKVCKPVINSASGSMKTAYLDSFGVGATELTGVGVQQMKDVGFLLREYYHKFIDSDYAAHTSDWEFMAKSGDRQQRSMMGITLGIFPQDVVPIDVPDKATDAILGGPAAACAPTTHDFILAWHETKGRELVQASSITPVLERVCNVSLTLNPVNSRPGGANPHAYIGDISDLMDSLKEARYGALLPISDLEHWQLTNLAFQLEQGAHFDFPGGPAMHAGGFPEHVLSQFQAIADAPFHKRPNDIPKFFLHACSRELHYGLAQLFGWMQNINIGGQPQGRIKAGTTFLWELHDDLMVHTKYFVFPMREPLELQKPMLLEEYQLRYRQAVEKCGDWKQLCVGQTNGCVAKNATTVESLPVVDAASSATASPKPSPFVGVSTPRGYFQWVGLGAILLVILAMCQRRGVAQGYTRL